MNNLDWYLDNIFNFLLPKLKIHNLFIYSLRMHRSFYQFTYHTLFTNCSSTANCIWVHSLLEWICKWLKNLVSEETLNWQSPSADLCIHFYCLSQLRHASQKEMIQSSALTLRLWLCQFKISLDNPAFNEKHLGFSKIIPVTAARIICLYLGHASLVVCQMTFYAPINQPPYQARDINTCSWLKQKC